MNFNQVILIGRIAHKVELKKTVQNNDYCYFNILVNRGDTTEKVDMIFCITWGKIANVLWKYGEIGRLIQIIGTLEIETSEQKDKKKSSYIINVSKLTFLDKKPISSKINKKPINSKKIDKKPVNPKTNKKFISSETLDKNAKNLKKLNS